MSLKNTARTPIIAPNSPILLDSYESRLASYTSWPHTRPGISDMAKAGFHRVLKPKWDGTKCSQCGLQLNCWEEYDDPIHEHMLHSPECPFLRALQAQEKTASNTTPTLPVGGVTSSASPELSMPVDDSMEGTPHAQATATAAEVSVSKGPTTPPSTDRSSPPPSQQTQCPCCGKPKANVPPNQMEEATLDAEDWVELGFKGEEKDGWIEV